MALGLAVITPVLLLAMGRDGRKYGCGGPQLGGCLGGLRKFANEFLVLWGRGVLRDREEDASNDDRLTKLCM